LEYSGARTGLLTTKGFRDELEFRRGYKESVFDVRLPRPYQIVPRELRLGVPERVTTGGEVLEELDRAAAEEAIDRLLDSGVEALAVCLFFSFEYPHHEQVLGELIKGKAPGLFLSLSSEVLPQIREYERVSTTVVNAYVGPVMQRYLESLARRLGDQGFSGRLYVMHSGGGVQSAEQAAKLAVGGLLSGPAGAVIGACRIGEQVDTANLITVDMGGTSYDVAVIRGGEPTVTTESWISRYRIALPMLDIHTIGAGGGSIAWLDDGGALHVGPRSAGSAPGPACYGRGGREPTVTDADLLLGYIDPDYFLGGEMRLDLEAAEKAMDRIAGPLGLTRTEAAHAVFRIVNNNMANAIQYVTTQRGIDPRDHVLMALGGAGAIHAGPQAEDLEITTIVVPRYSSVFSALGDVLADLKVSEVRTFITPLSDLELEELNARFEAMRASAAARLDVGSDAEDRLVAGRFVEMRYIGEVHELTVPVRSRTRRITELNVAATLKDFHDLHEQRFAHKAPDQPVELLNLRLELALPRRPPEFPTRAFGSEDPSPAARGTRRVYFGAYLEFRETPVFDGAALVPGNLVAGPAVINRPDTSLVVYPRQEALIDQYGNCIIELQGGRRP
jgi:N-methylhydantoinase A